MTERIDNLEQKPFLNGPAEFICLEISKQLRCIPEWVLIFGENIFPYKREDVPIRALPALRIYNEAYVREYESWFIDGEIILDIIFPDSLRREEIQQVQDTLSSAMLQQFRSHTFFAALGTVLPGLNELGKRFSVDKSLGYAWNKAKSEAIVPLTQIRLNFRTDLRQWDAYLERSDRTVDDPFHVTLGQLRRIATTIKALNDDGSTNLTSEISQKTQREDS